MRLATHSFHIVKYYTIRGDIKMKVTLPVARENMKLLLGGGAQFNWNESSLHGSWLSFTIQAIYSDRVEDICEKISNDWAVEVNDKSGLATFDLFDFTKENTVATVEKKTIFKVRQWLTRATNSNRNPIPMRTMEGVILQETNKAIKVKLNGLLQPSSNCLHCNRTLTHPVSLMYGLGPVCGGHFHINPCNTEKELKDRYNEMLTTIKNVTWEGWIPKSQVQYTV
jgi:hypothetical protein